MINQKKSAPIHADSLSICQHIWQLSMTLLETECDNEERMMLLLKHHKAKHEGLKYNLNRYSVNKVTLGWVTKTKLIPSGNS